MSSVSSTSTASQLAGLVGVSNSGLDIQGIISKLIAIDQQPITNMQNQEAKLLQQKTAYTTLQTQASTLLSKLRVLSTHDLLTNKTKFDSLTATSSNSAIATATVDSTATAQSLSMQVLTLPSATRATSTFGISNVSSTTTLSSLGITDGNFTIYDGSGNASTITVNATGGDTVQTMLTAINAANPNITGAVVDGKIQFTDATDATLSFGSGGDTSNFLTKFHLNTALADGTAHTWTSSQRTSSIDLNQAMDTAAANLETTVTDGTFSINGVSFDTTGKSLNDVIAAINGSAAGVTASYNAGNDTLQLVSKNPGSTYISLGASGDTSNFLTAVGLVNGANTTASQTLGTNAHFQLNGVDMYSTGTTVDSTVTGLTGVTLNLASAQVGTNVQINIQQDTAGIETAINDVVTAYNTLINNIDSATNAQNNGLLAGQTQLTSLRNQIRTTFTAAISGITGPYTSLGQVGISTGAVAAGSTATPTLNFDKTKFEAAWTANPNNVKQLFVGQNLGGALNGTTNDDGFDGIFTQLTHILSDTTYTDSNGSSAYGALYNGGTGGQQGLFPSALATFDSRKTTMDKSIADAQARLAKKQTMLQQQYSAMDQLVGQYQSQGSALSSLISQLSANNGK